MPAVPQSSEEALKTPQAEDGDPPWVHAHSVGASLTEEAARAVLKMRSYFVTSLRSFWSIFRAFPAGSLLLSPGMGTMHLGTLFPSHSRPWWHLLAV